ncbi:MAG: hypothetical protein M5R40_19680 [Anaerolineae bacterium]|nr:hypothetical protein [Anaerolineae bacterium]
MPGGLQDVLRLGAHLVVWAQVHRRGKFTNRRIAGQSATASATLVSLSGVGDSESMPPTFDSAMACQSGFRLPSMCTKTSACRSASMSASSL